MASIKDLFDKQQAGFTVYSPDCFQSRLWGNLDQFIHSATDFQPIYREWIYHDYNSIMRFYTPTGEELPAEQDSQEAAHKYTNIPAENLQYGHLVVQLFISAPSLLTIWQGDQVIERLFALKGRTHPSQADAETIRGSFFCDNGVCNLLHVSDDSREAEREIKAVNLEYLLEKEAHSLPLIEPIPLPTTYVAHSAIVLVCNVVKRVQMTMNQTDSIQLQLPPSGKAKETHDLLSALLQDSMNKMADSPLAGFIHAYLAGDIVRVTDMMKQLPLTKWEYFVIQCGTITRHTWETKAID